MKYGNVVQLVQDDKAVNALVLHSTMQPKVDGNQIPEVDREGKPILEEHLVLVVLDAAEPAPSGDALRAAVKTIFSVKPYMADRASGWRPVHILVEGEALPTIVHDFVAKETSLLREKLFHAEEYIKALGRAATSTNLPPANAETEPNPDHEPATSVVDTENEHDTPKAE